MANKLSDIVNQKAGNNGSNLKLEVTGKKNNINIIVNSLSQGEPKVYKVVKLYQDEIFCDE